MMDREFSYAELMEILYIENIQFFIRLNLGDQHKQPRLIDADDEPVKLFIRPGETVIRCSDTTPAKPQLAVRFSLFQEIFKQQRSNEPLYVQVGGGNFILLHELPMQMKNNIHFGFISAGLIRSKLLSFRFLRCGMWAYSFFSVLGMPQPPNTFLANDIISWCEMLNSTSANEPKWPVSNQWTLTSFPSSFIFAS